MFSAFILLLAAPFCSWYFLVWVEHISHWFRIPFISSQQESFKFISKLLNQPDIPWIFPPLSYLIISNTCIISVYHCIFVLYRRVLFMIKVMFQPSIFALMFPDHDWFDMMVELASRVPSEVSGFSDFPLEQTLGKYQVFVVVSVRPS